MRKNITVVVGGQFGSEGKGKLVAALARKFTSRVDEEVSVIRTGGPNAGHTVYYDRVKYILRQVPSAVVVKRAHLYIGAGSVFSPELLEQELDSLPPELHARDRLMVDVNAWPITGSMIEAEMDIKESIGSTGSGVGQAWIQRTSRECERLSCHLSCRRGVVVKEIGKWNTILFHQIILEGTQGFGLSLYHGSHPYLTSQDTTPAAFLSQAGLPVLNVCSVIMVIRTFPIRVGGRSGPLPFETSWEAVTRISESPNSLEEFTSVTKKLRRVAEFDWKQLREAVMICGPTSIAVHGLDYIQHSDYGQTKIESISHESRKFCRRIQDVTGVPVGWVFTSPETMIEILPGKIK